VGNDRQAINGSLYGDFFMRAARTDKNQKEIVAALRKIGASVASLHRLGGGVPDILVGYRGYNLLMEIKTPAKASKLNDRQLEWHAEWKGQACVVRCVEDALSAIQAFAIHCGSGCI